MTCYCIWDSCFTSSHGSHINVITWTGLCNDLTMILPWHCNLFAITIGLIDSCFNFQHCHGIQIKAMTWPCLAKTWQCLGYDLSMTWPWLRWLVWQRLCNDLDMTLPRPFQDFGMALFDFAITLRWLYNDLATFEVMLIGLGGLDYSASNC